MPGGGRRRRRAGFSAAAKAARRTSGPIPTAPAPASSPPPGRRWPRPGAGALADLHAVLGLAGANVPEAAARLAAELPFAAARIETDAFVALKGALGDGDGIVAAIGTGSVFGVQRGGTVRMIGGWGFLLGDQGSGAWIGRRLLRGGAARPRRARRGRARCSSPWSPRRAGRRVSLALGQRARPADFAAYGQRVHRRRAGRATRARRRSSPRRTGTSPRAVDALLAEGPVPVCFLGGLGAGLRARASPSAMPGLVRAPKGNALDGALRLARGPAVSRALLARKPSPTRGRGRSISSSPAGSARRSTRASSGPARACRRSARWRR